MLDLFLNHTPADNSSKIKLGVRRKKTSLICQNLLVDLELEVPKQAACIPP